jgi:HSP20 family molecular chaperone IbpA
MTPFRNDAFFGAFPGFSDWETKFPKYANKFISDWKPKADIMETDTEFKIHAELPGVSKDNMKVHYLNKENNSINRS